MIPFNGTDEKCENEQGRRFNIACFSIALKQPLSYASHFRQQHYFLPANRDKITNHINVIKSAAQWASVLSR